MIGEILQSVYLEKYKYQLYILSAAYLLALGTMTFIKITLYENPLTYWNSVRADYPTSFLPYVGLFNYYNHQEDIKNAEDQLRQAITIRPEELSIRNSLVDFYLRQKSFDKAMLWLKKTLVDKKIHSDYLLQKYISLLVEQKRYKELDDLSNAYQDNKNVLKKINEIKSGLIKQSKNPDNTKS
jgi:Tfp pilus assembly protein PilF